MAVEEVVHEAGAQFDPRVARAFAALPEPLFQALREPANRGAEGFTDPARSGTGARTGSSSRSGA